MNKGLTQEQLLAIWLEKEPSARSTYQLYGCPPMWETMREGNAVLFTCPRKTMARPAPFAPYQEVDGVCFRWQLNGEWIGQEMSTPFSRFMETGPQRYELERLLGKPDVWQDMQPYYRIKSRVPVGYVYQNSGKWYASIQRDDEAFGPYKSQGIAVGAMKRRGYSFQIPPLKVQGEVKSGMSAMPNW